MNVGLLWDIDFTELMNKPIELHTAEGTVYKGVLTGIEWQSTRYSHKGKEVLLEWPLSFQLNGEKADGIGFGVVKLIKVT